MVRNVPRLARISALRHRMWSNLRAEPGQRCAIASQANRFRNKSGAQQGSVIVPLAIGDDALPQTAHTSLAVDRCECVPNPSVSGSVPCRDALAVCLHLYFDQISGAGDCLTDDTG